jgi:hypothetical protein
MKNAVLKELQIAGRDAGLANFEIIEGVMLTDLEWSVQNVRLEVILEGIERYG